MEGRGAASCCFHAKFPSGCGFWRICCGCRLKGATQQPGAQPQGVISTSTMAGSRVCGCIFHITAFVQVRCTQLAASTAARLAIAVAPPWGLMSHSDTAQH